MIVDFKKVSQKLMFAYNNYKKEKDDPNARIDWLDHVINGVYTQEDDKDFWIIFRGTDPNKDSDALNIKFFAHKLPYEGVNPKIWVHTGLITTYDRPECRGILHTRTAEALKAGKNIWVTGHSQGGGMAQICAVDLQYTFGAEIEDRLFVVPVAPMRAGNKYFVESFNRRIKNCLVIWKGSDYVPGVPLGLMGYVLPEIKVQVNARGFFEDFGNFFSAPVKFVFKGRQHINNNPDHFLSILFLLGMGPEWNFTEDHRMDDWPEFILDTDTLKKDKLNKLKF